MDNYERTIDLVHVFNYVKYNLKKIVITTIVFALLGVGLVTAKNIISPSEKLYYSTAKILFKFDSWSTSEKDYSLEDWNLSGTEKELYDSNGAFLSNSKYVFLSDRILMNLMDTYGVNQKLSKFKDNIIVEHITNSDLIRIVVTSDNSDIAEEMLNTIISEGIKSVENLYKLKYEVIDQYTYSGEPFSKLELDKNGEIDLSSNLMTNIKIIILIMIAGFGISFLYYVVKCVFNEKVESVDVIEKGMGIHILQLLEANSSNYELSTTKLINDNHKTILFIGISKNDGIGEDIVYISKMLLSRNRKPLIMCVSCQNSYSVLGCELKDTVSECNGIDIVYTTIDDFDKKLKGLEDKYDFVLIEVSSAEENSDSLLLSKNVESTVLVNKCNTATYEEFRRVVNDLNKYGKGVTGVIFKDVTKDSSSYKYVK